MLLELAVENYAVVDSSRVPFHPGLNLLTGETGSGKSILVGALELLFGGRASADVIRSGRAEGARVRTLRGRRQPRFGRAAASRGPRNRRRRTADRARDSVHRQEPRLCRAAAPPTAAHAAETSRRIWAISTASTISSSSIVPDAQRDMLDAFRAAQALRESVRDAYRKLRAVEARTGGARGQRAG